MQEKKKEEKIEDALLKVALGFQVAEVTEEFAEVDGELKLTKRKKTKKDVPPDLKAVQMLLGEGNALGMERLSDEELEEERKRLLTALQAAEKEKTSTHVRVEQKSAVVRKTRAKPRKRVTKKKKED